MSCVAELNATSHSIASDIWKKLDIGRVRATSASDVPIASCIARIQRRFVPKSSTTGDQSGLMTQGRYSQLVYSAMSALEMPSVLYMTTVMDIALPLAGVMTLWMGILAVGEKAGAIDFVARIIGPFFSRIFHGVPKDHPATGLMVMNYSANFLGLDNAATPIGLKAMESLQTLNPKKDEATDAQLMFLVLNTAGMTLIPVSVMAQRAILGAKDPSDIFIPTLIASFAGTLVALVAVALRQRIRLLHPVVLAWRGGLTFFMLGVVWCVTQFLTKSEIQ